MSFKDEQYNGKPKDVLLQPHKEPFNPSDYMPIVEPTTEQLVEELEKAGFTPSEDGEEFFCGDIELEHSKSTTEVVIWGGTPGNRRCVIKECKDLASAVKLALCLQEVVK